LDKGKVAGAGLDVFEEEPPQKVSVSERLAKHDKVIATHHDIADTEALEDKGLDGIKGAPSRKGIHPSQ